MLIHFNIGPTNKPFVKQGLYRPLKEEPFGPDIRYSIRFRWSLITIKHNYEADFENVQQFLESQGKQKYTLPIYRALMKGSEDTRRLAAELFTLTKSQLHMVVQQYVRKILD